MKAFLILRLLKEAVRNRKYIALNAMVIDEW
jgi:hypothetical protein